MLRRDFITCVAGSSFAALSLTGRASEKEYPLAGLLNLADIETVARKVLGQASYDYYASGAADELTLRWNVERLQNLLLRPRVLRDVSNLDTTIELLGRRHVLPIMLAPTANHRLAHPMAEIATARGAALGGIGMVLSNGSNTHIRDVATALGPEQALWFQLYVQPDRQLTLDIIRNAEAGGAEAIVITVDSPVDGSRNRQARSGWRLPEGAGHPNYLGRRQRRSVVTLDEVRPLKCTWNDLEWIRETTRLPMLLKGILNPDDAELALLHGAAGVIVSNHGGRVLDTAPASIDALPAVVDRVAGRVPVIFDSGIRRGSDVLKALACGAQAVLIGRPYLYGLAVGGAEGVAHVIRILRQELKLSMALTGCRAAGELDRSFLW